MSDVMTVHEVLCKARNLIDREGWAQGASAMMPSGPACAMGAIGRVAKVSVHPGGFLRYGEVWQTAAAQAVAAPIGVTNYDDFWQWNDAWGRTKEEVFAAFDRAIAATAPAPDLQLTTPGASVHCPAAGRSHRGPEPKVEAVR